MVRNTEQLTVAADAHGCNDSIARPCLLSGRQTDCQPALVQCSHQTGSTASLLQMASSWPGPRAQKRWHVHLQGNLLHEMEQPLPSPLWQFLGVQLYHTSPMRRCSSASTSLEGPKSTVQGGNRQRGLQRCSSRHNER